MKKSKLIIALLAGLAVAGFTTSALADDTNSITITGNMVCAKCKLHETSSCQNVIQVDQGGKTVNYYLAKNDLSTSMHDDVCMGDGKKMTATGTVQTTDGKLTLTPTTLKPAE